MTSIGGRRTVGHPCHALVVRGGQRAHIFGCGTGCKVGGFQSGERISPRNGLRSLCNLDEFVGAIADESKPAWMAFVRAAPHVGERNEEHARLQLEAFKKGLDQVAGLPGR
jgi:hypothetical protein